jgi:hypothetical protein
VPTAEERAANMHRAAAHFALARALQLTGSPADRQKCVQLPHLLPAAATEGGPVAHLKRASCVPPTLAPTLTLALTLALTITLVLTPNPQHCS